MPQPGSKRWEDIKDALKIALYSTVYGMHAPSVKGKFTRRMKALLGDESGRETGRKLGRHPLIAELLKARDEQLQRLEVGQTLVGPTGISVTIEKPLGSDGEGVDPKSAMATIAQSCEQYLMASIIEVIVEREETVSRNHLRAYLWLHDGAYLKMRSTRKRSKELQVRLDAHAERLAQWAENREEWDTTGAPPVRFDIDQL